MRYFIWISLLMIIIGCNPKKISKATDKIIPDSIIPKGQMIRILIDVHLTEAALIYMRNHGKENKKVANEYYDLLYSKFKVSKKRFSENLVYYQEDQENFVKMYDEVIRQLTTLSKDKKGDED